MSSISFHYRSITYEETVDEERYVLHSLPLYRTRKRTTTHQASNGIQSWQQNTLPALSKIYQPERAARYLWVSCRLLIYVCFVPIHILKRNFNFHPYSNHQVYIYIFWSVFDSNKMIGNLEKGNFLFIFSTGQRKSLQLASSTLFLGWFWSRRFRRRGKQNFFSKPLVIIHCLIVVFDLKKLCLHNVVTIFQVNTQTIIQLLETGEKVRAFTNCYNFFSWLPEYFFVFYSE